jgi:hypothetical protein
MLRAFALGLLAAVGAACAVPPAADMLELDPSEDQRAIAAHYQHEAALYERKAAELLERASVYEAMFGAESDWVRGTRLLASYYEEQARDRAREADRHLSFSGGALR